MNGLLISNCCGQACNGYVWPLKWICCKNASLNLCLQDCGRNCAFIRDALTVASELPAIIHGSLKRLAQFKCLQEGFSKGLPELKPLCPTRWTVRTGAMHAVISNYSIIFLELEKLELKLTQKVVGRPLGL